MTGEHKTSDYTVELEWMPDPESNYKRMAKLGNTSDNLPEIILVTPPEFKKGIPDNWSPEHLFVSSVVACFFTTFVAISDSSNLKLTSLRIRGVGTLEKDADGKEAITKIDLYPEIIIDESENVEKARKIAEKTEKNCLIANSMKSEIIMTPDIKNA
ncbi:MAG TPA: OsmC family protein [Candidatus Lokiarchaeia archaeon]|nr:OsmC family protein [Candidatus Lokiarchaeia archaeon]